MMILKARFARKMFDCLLLLICSLFLLGGILVSHGIAATLKVDDTSGQLLGASGVMIGGQSYEVEFYEGSADSIWGPDFNFTFATESKAISAMQALLEQVFIGEFDTNPDFTNYITHSQLARIVTPYEITGSINGRDYYTYVQADNHRVETYDTVRYGSNYNSYVDADLTNNTNYYAMALWTGASPVPVPNSLILLGFGCLSLAGFSRKKLKNS